MAQIKSLKFNDNVLQVDSSYVIGGTTYSRDNIKVGSFHIADDCGAILHFEGYTPSLSLQDSSGNTCINLGGSTYSDASIDMRCSNGDYIHLIASCGRFRVEDTHNVSLFKITQGNSDNADAIAIGAYGPMVGDMSGDLVIYDDIGTRLAVFSADNGGTRLQFINHTIKDSCGFRIEDSCGNGLFEIPYGMFVHVESDGTLKLKSTT